MDTIREALTVLSSAESSLRKLIEKGLRGQSYLEVAEVARMADGVARLLGNISTSSANGMSKPFAVDTSPRKGASFRVAPVQKRPKTTSKEFPRFERDDDKLVKIGWSKKNKACYEHRASHSVVVAFAQHLVNHVQEGKVFAVEDLTPVPDIVNSGEIPAYQVYLALAWLRKAGAIDKKGRDGYVLRRGALTTENMEKLWAAVPIRNE